MKWEVYDIFTKKAEFKATFDTFEQKIIKINSDIVDLKTKVHNTESGFSSLYTSVTEAKASVDDKVSQGQVAKIIEKFQNYSTHEQLKELYGKVLPALKIVQDKETSLEEEFIRLRDVVSRFDEVLNSKTSKFSLEQLENIVKTLPIKSDVEVIKSSVEEKLIDMQNKIEDMGEKMDMYKNNAMSNIEESIKLAVSHISHSVIAVQSPQDFDPSDVYEKLDQKVNDVVFSSELDTKYNLVQAEKLSLMMDTIHKQLKTMSVVI